MPTAFPIDSKTKQKKMSKMEPMHMTKSAPNNSLSIFPGRNIPYELLCKDRISPFTERETQVLSALLEGLTYKAIAKRYFISINTVKTYQKRLYADFGVRSRQELLLHCLKASNA